MLCVAPSFPTEALTPQLLGVLVAHSSQLSVSPLELPSQKTAAPAKTLLFHGEPTAKVWSIGGPKGPSTPSSSRSDSRSHSSSNPSLYLVLPPPLPQVLTREPSPVTFLQARLHQSLFLACPTHDRRATFCGRRKKTRAK